jgi:uncharacterized protein YeaO (DUF488 family)
VGRAGGAFADSRVVGRLAPSTELRKSFGHDPER